MPPVGKSALIFGGLNGLGFGISAATGSHVHLDLIGTGAFAVAALFCGPLAGGRASVSAAGVAIWGAKLAGFLFYRALQVKHDARLTDTLSSTSGAFGFWFISFLWGWFVSLPHTLAAGAPVVARAPMGGFTCTAGIAVYALGLLIETLADGQKWLFKKDPANSGKFCDVGVWQLSQHPNWFGNLMIWSGILLFNTPTLLAAWPKGAGWLRRVGRFAGSAFSPLFLLALFYGQATGGITNTVELTDKKYGNDPRYVAYVRDTPLVLPTLRSIARTLGLAKAPPMQ